MIRANFSAYSTYITDSRYQWDLNEILTVEGRNRYNADTLLADGLHPNDAWHLALANVICRFVADNLGL